MVVRPTCSKHKSMKKGGYIESDKEREAKRIYIDLKSEILYVMERWELDKHTLMYALTDNQKREKKTERMNENRDMIKREKRQRERASERAGYTPSETGCILSN